MNKFGGFISAMHSFDVFIRTFDSMLFLAMLGNSIFSYVLIVTISEKKRNDKLQIFHGIFLWMMTHLHLNGLTSAWVSKCLVN